MWITIYLIFNCMQNSVILINANNIAEQKKSTDVSVSSIKSCGPHSSPTLCNITSPRQLVQIRANQARLNTPVIPPNNPDSSLNVDINKITRNPTNNVRVNTRIPDIQRTPSAIPNRNINDENINFTPSRPRNLNTQRPLSNNDDFMNPNRMNYDEDSNNFPRRTRNPNLRRTRTTMAQNYDEMNQFGEENQPSENTRLPLRRRTRTPQPDNYDSTEVQVSRRTRTPTPAQYDENSNTNQPNIRRRTRTPAPDYEDPPRRTRTPGPTQYDDYDSNQNNNRFPGRTRIPGRVQTRTPPTTDYYDDYQNNRFNYRAPDYRDNRQPLRTTLKDKFVPISLIKTSTTRKGQMTLWTTPSTTPIFFIPIDNPLPDRAAGGWGADVGQNVGEQPRDYDPFNRNFPSTPPALFPATDSQFPTDINRINPSFITTTLAPPWVPNPAFQITTQSPWWLPPMSNMNPAQANPVFPFESNINVRTTRRDLFINPGQEFSFSQTSTPVPWWLPPISNGNPWTTVRVPLPAINPFQGNPLFQSSTPEPWWLPTEATDFLRRTTAQQVKGVTEDIFIQFKTVTLPRYVTTTTSTTLPPYQFPPMFPMYPPMNPSMFPMTPLRQLPTRRTTGDFEMVTRGSLFREVSTEFFIRFTRQTIPSNVVKILERKIKTTTGSTPRKKSTKSTTTKKKGKKSVNSTIRVDFTTASSTKK